MAVVMNNTLALKKEVPHMLELAGLRDNYVAQKIGMHYANFSEKKQRSTWSDEELKKIVTLLTKPNEDVLDYFDNLEADLAAKGDYVTEDEYKKLINASKG